MSSVLSELFVCRFNVFVSSLLSLMGTVEFCQSKHLYVYLIRFCFLCFRAIDTNSTELVDVDVALGMDSDTQPPTKHRKKKSEVWNHFTTETVSPDTLKARCMHCNKSFAYMTGNKSSGTSHLKRHIYLGICSKSR